ncbi:MAG: hypothetical protein JWL77_1499 [Chthonomonadaceae bacterium]|nr:hypothetical protein [Chthonomonadaceae bacterium]
MSNELDRRGFLAGVGGAALTFSAAATQAHRGASPDSPPNVLLIFMDDQTYRSLGALNNSEVHTPNLDRLMARGTTFTHAFNQGSWSGAVCIPSRAMLISGLTVWHAQDRLEKVPLWGEWFAEHGYTTFLTGKWHNGEATLKRCFTEIGPYAGGFLPSDPAIPDAQNAAYNRPMPGNDWRPDDPARGGHWMQVDGKVIHSSERWANAAIDFLKQQADARRQDPKAKPFLMHVAFHAPHDPRQCPREFLEMYPREKIAIPPNYLPEHPFDQGDARCRDEILAPFPRTEEAVRLHRQEYYAILSHADRQIGRILDTLEATGQSRNTIVMFSADHGLAVGQHGLMGKQNQYDHSVRIPLIIAGPNIPAGKRRDALVYQSGLFPTACELCGLPIPRTVEHRSLTPLIRQGKGDGYAVIYGGYRDLQRMVRDHEWKLILYPKAGKTQLFHIDRDPWEQHNLADEARYHATIKDYTDLLRKLQKDLDDTLVLT